jgi:hypothetical protein
MHSLAVVICSKLLTWIARPQIHPQQNGRASFEAQAARSADDVFGFSLGQKAAELGRRRSNHVLFPGDAASHKPARHEQYCSDAGSASGSNEPTTLETKAMSLGLILVILLVIFLFGGFSGRFGGYGYGYGHGGIGVIGVILIIIVVLMLLGRI